MGPDNQKPEPSVEVANAVVNGLSMESNQTPDPSPQTAKFSLSRKEYFGKYVPLHKAALKGDWEAAKELLVEDPTLVRTHITEGGETALHLAAAEGRADFVKNLLERMTGSDLEIHNEMQSNALCFAATTKRVDIAKMIVEANKNLIRGEKGVKPLHNAALQGHKEMADYLFNESDFQSWDVKDQIKLLTRSIDSGLYDLAVKIVEQNRTLAVAEDENGETPLEVLARKPLAFCCTRRQGFWDNIASTIFYYRKLKACSKSEPYDAYSLLDYLWSNVICQEDVETAQLQPDRISELLYIAAESGNESFLVKLISKCPDLMYKVSDSRSIFHIAVLRRYVEVFNLTYELHGVKDLIISFIDEENGNNILHLAAKLVPDQLNSIPGPALQMQREVLWFKVSYILCS